MTSFISHNSSGGILGDNLILLIYFRSPRSPFGDFHSFSHSLLQQHPLTTVRQSHLLKSFRTTFNLPAIYYATGLVRHEDNRMGVVGNGLRGAF